MPQTDAVPTGTIRDAHKSLKLMEVGLRRQTLPGFDLGYDSKSGNKYVSSKVWRGNGFDGLHVIGRGNRETYIEPKSHQDRGLTIALEAGYVLLENMTIRSGQAQAIWMGINHFQYAQRGMAGPRATLHLRDCTIDTNNPCKWGLFTYWTDVLFEGCDLHCEQAYEHAFYPHGFSQYGVGVYGTRVHGSGGENLKGTNRPHAKFYPPGVRPGPHANLDATFPAGIAYVIEDCHLTNWFAPGGSQAGAAVALQGTALDVYVRRTIMEGAASPRHRTFFVDDGGIEHFGHGTQVAGADPATGNVLLEECLLWAPGDMKSSASFSRVGPLGARSRNQPCKSLTIRNCGVYAENGRFELVNVPSVTVEGCNTPEIADEVFRRGYDATHECNLQDGSHFAPLSQDYQR